MEICGRALGPVIGFPFDAVHLDVRNGLGLSDKMFPGQGGLSLPSLPNASVAVGYCWLMAHG